MHLPSSAIGMIRKAICRSVFDRDDTRYSLEECVANAETRWPSTTEDLVVHGSSRIRARFGRRLGDTSMTVAPWTFCFLPAVSTYGSIRSAGVQSKMSHSAVRIFRDTLSGFSVTRR